MNRQTDILSFWFGDVTIIFHHIEERLDLWFRSKPHHDVEIKKLFATDVEKAANGDYDDWANEPRGQLALIILLDQLPRVIYRHHPDAFRTDAEAMQVVLDGIKKQHDEKLTPIERVFFYMPFQHTEDLELQKKGVQLFKELYQENSDSEQQCYFERFYDFALRHYNVIAKFGRFPHRNQYLGRSTTPEELEFLKHTPGGF